MRICQSAWNACRATCVMSAGWATSPRHRDSDLPDVTGGGLTAVRPVFSQPCAAGPVPLVDARDQTTCTRACTADVRRRTNVCSGSVSDVDLQDGGVPRQRALGAAEGARHPQTWPWNRGRAPVNGVPCLTVPLAGYAQLALYADSMRASRAAFQALRVSTARAHVKPRAVESRNVAAIERRDRGGLPPGHGPHARVRRLSGFGGACGTPGDERSWSEAETRTYG